MDLVNNLVLGFSTALSLANLLYAFFGVLIGTLIGVLPGIGPLATIAMLLPITFGLPPVGALIMLAGIYYGAQYGGSTTAILVNIPGEATSASGGPKRAMIRVHTVPAKNEPIAAIASAGPARPWRAIW